MPQPKYANQHYFDLESRTEGELKASFYVLGTLFGRGALVKKGIEFNSKSKELVNMVKYQFQSEHVIQDIQETESTSYRVRIRVSPYLRSKLEKIGLGLDKSQRGFPSQIVSNKYLGHFIRGFADSRARVFDVNGLIRATFNYNKAFLVGMHEVLQELAGVQCDAPSRNRITYSNGDAKRIYSFIYSDWEFVQSRGPYAPSVKDIWDSKMESSERIRPHRAEMEERIRAAKIMLISGESPTAVLTKLGFERKSTFYHAFKRIAGETPSSFSRRMSSVKRAVMQPLPRLNYFGNLTVPSRSYAV